MATKKADLDKKLFDTDIVFRKLCEKLKKLHARMGSDNANESDAAKRKIRGLLDRHHERYKKNLARPR
jgi:hypothetical protein